MATTALSKTRLKLTIDIYHYAIMKNTLILLCLFLLTACKKDKQDANFNVQANIDIAVFDPSGNDHLKKIGEESISKIRLYYLIDGKKVLFNRSNLDAPYGFLTFKPEKEGDRYWLRLFLYNTEKNGSAVKSTTYLRWEDGREDEIIAEFNNRSNSRVLVKFWYNKKEINRTENQRYFQITSE
ncbi:hypothetical protein DBR43_04525 [Pedobacter sp. KBW06]|uniref:hypothetical protein n=1 Tax=Pedobacter sp. KBW06 TaxID=2153359 RepID=UPI000F5AF787|nr:hypothetical protein [Pedobacter sp. KBW06]RQO74656.1 hypothetical protein DBR43_04525 [Pedobacter sp. KBW06]